MYVSASTKPPMPSPQFSTSSLSRVLPYIRPTGSPFDNLQHHQQQLKQQQLKQKQQLAKQQQQQQQLAKKQQIQQQQKLQQQQQQQHLQNLLKEAMLNDQTPPLQQLQSHTSNNHQSSTPTTNAVTTPATTTATPSSIDINTLREKSKHLDLPLISALCNDRSLLKQTKAFVMPKHPRLSNASTANSTSTSTNATSPKAKYPVSGLSTTQLAKPRKPSISHRHPNDKLPPLPMQTAEGNNYVMDPTPAAVKHKSYNSQPNL